MKIISEPWVVADDKMRKKSSMNAGLFSNPEEVDLSSPSKGFKTGMQGVLSELIE